MPLGPSEQLSSPRKLSACWVLSPPVPSEEPMLLRNSGGMVREQVPLVPVPSHHMAACDIGGLDLVIQVPLVLHIREEWYLGMEDVQEQSCLLHEC